MHAFVDVAADRVEAWLRERVRVCVARNRGDVEDRLARPALAHAHIVQHVLAVAEHHGLTLTYQEQAGYEGETLLIHDARLGGRWELTRRLGIKDDDGGKPSASWTCADDLRGRRARRPSGCVGRRCRGCGVVGTTAREKRHGRDGQNLRRPHHDLEAILGAAIKALP